MTLAVIFFVLFLGNLCNGFLQNESSDNICVQNGLLCPAVDGPDSIYKPLPDCTKFCQCSNGVPYLHTCPFGLEFNPTLNVCDWPEDAGCTGGAAASDDTTQNPTEETTAQGSTTTAASGDDICVQNNIVCPAIDGPDSVYKPLPDCTKFCQCSNGVPYSHTCPFGLEFNPTLNVCDWPEDAGCTGGAATSDETTQSPTEETTAQGSTTTAASGDDICVQNNIVCPAVDGPDSVYKPLPDCTKFCQCSNGVPYSYTCPFGLEFNPTLNVCDWPEDAGCTGGAATSDETTQSPTEETTAQSSTTTAASGDDICVQNDIVCPSVDGPDSVYKPLPDCTKFCQCSNGVPYSHSCPFGLEFNPTLNVCDWPEDAGCTGGATDQTTQSPTEETTAQGSTTTAASGDDICVQNNIVCPAVDGPDSVYKPLPDCTKFCQCSNGVPYAHTCPFGLEFNPTLNVCDWPEDAGCTGGAAASDDTTQNPTEETTAQGSTTTAASGDDICVQNNIVCPAIDGPDSVYKPLPDCTKFCQCSNGVPYSHSCPFGLEFNPTLNVCDWPEDAGCTGGAATSDETTQTPTEETTAQGSTTTAASGDDICVQNNIVCPAIDGPDSVYKPLPDCTKFCQCSNGVPYSHTCPFGLEFNPTLNVCDWPEDAGCTGGATDQTTQSPTEETTAQGSTTTAASGDDICVQNDIVCPSVDGPDSVYKPLPDCTKFCQCSNGVPYSHTCPFGLEFNPTLNVCDWPEDAGCTGGAATSDETTQSPTEETTAQGSTTTAASGDDICVQNNIVCPAVDGPDSVYKPLPDCTKFCQCSNGVPYSHTCPFGLEFNPTLNVCDWPEDAGCTGGAATSDETTQSPTEETTAQGSTTTAASGDDICVQNNIVCPSVDGPDSVYKPLPDCTKFCQCSNGVPYSHTCPFGLEFNPTLNVCDWPEDAGCTGGAATSDETTQSPTEETTAQGSTTDETTSSSTNKDDTESSTENSTPEELTSAGTTENSSSTTDSPNSDVTETTEVTTKNIPSIDAICLQSNIVCPEVDGPDSVYGALPDCSRFCQCSNGVPYLHFCPTGLLFNPILNVCDWPENAGCVGDNSTTTDSATTSYSSTEIPITEKTASQSSTSTASDSNGLCLQSSIVCPAFDGLDSIYGALLDCTKFCQCSNGVPYLHTCPAGLNFNPSLNVCDWPQNAGCAAA